MIGRTRASQVLLAVSLAGTFAAAGACDGGANDLDRFCDVAVGTQANEGEDAGLPPRAQDLAAFDQDLDELAAVAPAELEDDYAVLVEYFQDHTTNDVVDADQRVIDAITHVQDHVGEHCSGLD